MAAHENSRARVLTIPGSPQVAWAQVARMVQGAGEAAVRSDRVHVIQYKRGISQGQAHGGFSMLWFRELRNLLSMMETGPVGGSRSSTTGPGLKGFRPKSDRWYPAGTRNGGRCLVLRGRVLREGVLDGLGAPPAVTVIPADVTDAASGGNRIRRWRSAAGTRRAGGVHGRARQ